MDRKPSFVRLEDLVESTGIPREKIEEYEENFGELLNLKRDSRGQVRYAPEDADKFSRIHNMAVKGLSSRAIIRLFQVEPERKAAAPNTAKTAGEGLRAALVENLLSRVSERISGRLDEFGRNFETRQTEAVRRLAGIMETQVQIFSSLKNLQAAVEKKSLRSSPSSTLQPEAVQLLEERLDLIESAQKNSLTHLSEQISESQEQIFTALRKALEEVEKKMRSKEELSSLSQSEATRVLEDRLESLEEEKREIESRVSNLIDEKAELERIKEHLESLLEEADRQKSRKKSGHNREDEGKSREEDLKNSEEYRKVYDENLLLRKAIEERDRAIAERDMIIDELSSQEW